MNVYLIAAAVLAFLAAPLHSVLGERLIFSRLFQVELPELSGSDVFTKRVLRLFWHAVGIAWWGFAAVLALFAFRPELDQTARVTASIVGWTFLASSVYAFIQSRGKHFAWAIFLAIAACIWLGLR